VSLLRGDGFTDWALVNSLATKNQFLKFMALQDGIFKVKGTLGGVTFMKTADGYIARMKGGVDGSRIKSDPKFERVRENNAEFGRAGKASKILRKSFRSLILGLADSRATSRLTTLFMKAIKADETSLRGARTVTAGEVGFLKGFEFNNRVRLETSFVAPYTVTIDRATGQASIAIPAFNPSQVIGAPPGATHCRIVSAGAKIDFDGETYVGANGASTDIDLNAVQQAPINLTSLVGPGGTLPIFLALGIEFYQQVNQRLYGLSNGAFNALSIVEVDRAA
jgi:hypothetical protein